MTDTGGEWRRGLGGGDAVLFGLIRAVNQAVRRRKKNTTTFSQNEFEAALHETKTYGEREKVSGSGWGERSELRI